MQNNDIKSATGLISHYDLLLKHRIINVTDSLRNLLTLFEQTDSRNVIVGQTEKIKEELSEVLTLADEIAKLIDKNFISGLARNIFFHIKWLNSEARHDIGTMMFDLKRLVKIAREIAAFLESIKSGTSEFTQMKRRASEYVEKLEYVKENFEKALVKSIYAEEFAANADFYGRKIWEARFHNKFYWLYHGTSVLFLKNIQKCGLDSSKISKGIHRALAAVSSYVKQAGLIVGASIKPPFDLVDTSEAPFVYLTPVQDTVSAAMASNLPAFLYEILNESALTDAAKEKMMGALSEEDRFILRSCWRFGRILRSRNKRITLHIKVDSNFLKHYGVPDIFGDYEEFIRCEFDRYPDISPPLSAFNSAFPTIFQKSFSKLVESAVRESPLFGDKIKGWDWNHVVLINVPPEFIYINVQGKLIPIARFTEDMVPYVM